MKNLPKIEEIPLIELNPDEMKEIKEELAKEADQEAQGLPAKRRRGGKNVHGLTEMEEAFCAHYAKTKNMKASLMEAGYSIGNGGFWTSKGKVLLEKPRIQKRIEEIQALAAVDIGMSREIFHRKILDIYDGAMGAGEFKDANMAMRLLGEALNYFEEPVKKNLNISANLNQLPPEKRLEGLRKLASALGMKND